MSKYAVVFVKVVSENVMLYLKKLSHLMIDCPYKSRKYGPCGKYLHFYWHDQLFTIILFLFII